MPILDKFALWGAKAFTDNGWHRVAFQPVLFLFLWGAVIRMVVSDRLPPVPLDSVFNGYVEGMWVALGLACPPLALLAWCLIAHCSRWHRSTLAGMWLRLGADLGMGALLVIFHIVAVSAELTAGESGIYMRYIMGAILFFTVMLVLRDVWSLMMTEKLAGVMEREGGGGTD